ncbi:hypothetical protein RA2_03280 [Roseovarius sp. A-2]|uniref:GTA head formation protein, RCAP_rcc01685 family n=1 Tax=Roseovarius sp. A-2 TaxID=1570360 RepID=UPI0009B55D97|nr:hypothetical protein [Roseovarius sp. A-2]GAW36210.1 hypothetical protein RA2_03280 [Roseovarius sp. A-2]
MAEGAPPSRYGFEPFDCAPALRLEAHERVSELQVTAMQQRLERLEAALERLERRLWLAVYGVVAAILVQAFQPILAALP